MSRDQKGNCQFRLASPPANFFKINIDASYNHHIGETGLGMVTRNSNGEVLLRALFRLSRTRGPLHAEILAILHGLKIAIQKETSKML